MTILELRNQLTAILAGLLGTYKFPSGQQVSAVAVLPDAVHGYDFPPVGTTVTGLEVVIIPSAKSQNQRILGGSYVVDSTQISLKQWNPKTTLIPAINRIIDYWGESGIEVRPRVLPMPGMNNIETCTIFYKSHLLTETKDL